VPGTFLAVRSGSDPEGDSVSVNGIDAVRPLRRLAPVCQPPAPPAGGLPHPMPMHAPELRRRIPLHALTALPGVPARVYVAYADDLGAHIPIPGYGYTDIPVSDISAHGADVRDAPRKHITSNLDDMEVPLCSNAFDVELFG